VVHLPKGKIVDKEGTFNMEQHYTPQEIADKLKVSTKTVYRWIEGGKIKAVKVGGKGGVLRIPESEIQAILTEDV
jgi:excisionase family DNA binding protein